MPRKTAQPSPTPGRIVTYTFPDDFAVSPNVPEGETQTVPAIIVAVHTDDCVNLRVFTDGDMSVMRQTSVTRSDKPGVPGFWAWPERADG